MADEGDVLTDLNLDSASASNGADNEPVAGVISQYVKDLSVENPNAPASFQWQSQPNIDLQFNIGATQINEEVHEVELKIKVSSKVTEGDQFLVELAYCGLVGLRNLPDEHAHAFLYAEAPRILFPFARRVIDPRPGLPAADGRSDRLQRPLPPAASAPRRGRRRRGRAAAGRPGLILTPARGAERA